MKRVIASTQMDAGEDLLRQNASVQATNSPIRKLRKSIAVALMVLLILSGCSGSVDGPVIEGNRRNGGTDAEVFGEIVIASGCLYLHWPDSGIRYPVIWPHGTAWDAERSAVVLPGGTLAYDGDWVEGTGGYHSANLDEYTVSQGVEVAVACVDNLYGEIVVFNSSSDVDVRR